MEARKRSCREKSGSVLFDERMGEEWQLSQPRYGITILVILVSVLFVYS